MNPNAPLAEIMTLMPVTINPNTKLTEIYVIFESNKFHHIPVIEQGRLVGIISREDFLQMEHVLTINWSGNLTTGNQFEDFSARDIMTEYPMHLGPEDTIGLAADIILTNKFHALPILEDDMLVGIVTAHDLLAFAFSSPLDQSE